MGIYTRLKPLIDAIKADIALGSGGSAPISRWESKNTNTSRNYNKNTGETMSLYDTVKETSTAFTKVTGLTEGVICNFQGLISVKSIINWTAANGVGMKYSVMKNGVTIGKWVHNTMEGANAQTSRTTHVNDELRVELGDKISIMAQRDGNIYTAVTMSSSGSSQIIITRLS